MALGLCARAVASSPEVMMGEMPSSMSVPRLEASRTLPERATRTASVAMRPHLGAGRSMRSGVECDGAHRIQ